MPGVISSLTLSREDEPQTPVERLLWDRFTTKTFVRSDGTPADGVTASAANPETLEKVVRCLELARLSPSSFNAQPYKIVVVHSVDQKTALAPHFLGPNIPRILDSDCTLLFLADKAVLNSWETYSKFRISIDHKGRPPNNYLPVVILSSGFAVPEFVRTWLSLGLRSLVAVADWLVFTLTGKSPLPSAATSSTWAGKQVGMVGMAFMMGCTAQGIETTCMEGFNPTGVAATLGIPSRYGISFAIAAGKAQEKPEYTGSTIRGRRYPMEEVIYDDRFGNQVTMK